MNSWNLLFYVLLAAALICLAGYYFIFQSIKNLILHKKIRKNGILTEALVIDFKKIPDAEGMIMYHKVIQYKRIDGKTITSVAEFGSGAAGKTGKQIEIYYLPENAEMFVEKNSAPWIYYIMIVAGIGGIAVCIGALITKLLPSISRLLK